MAFSLTTFLILILVLSLCTYLALKTYIFATTVRSIPTPNNGPLIGNLFTYLGNSKKLFYNFRQLSGQYYPIYRLSIFFITAVSILDPNDVEIILSSSKHISKTYIYGFLKDWLGTGLLTSTGKKWQKRRKILTPGFHFNILQQFVDIFNSEAKKLVQQLQLECKEKEVDIVPLVTNFTLQSIEETAMGVKNFDSHDHIEYKQAVFDIIKLLLKRSERPWNHIPAIYKMSSLWKLEKKLLNILHNFTNTMIYEREKSFNIDENKSKRLAMLDLLIAARAKGADLDHEGIREEVDTFMFEGHDTTAVAISYLCLILANHPEIQEQVFKEIVEVLGRDKEPTYYDLQNLTYTECCIKETLRLFPSVPFISRFASEDFKTSSGYNIPKGTILHIHIFDIHRNPEIYPDPLKFDPDRFLPENSSGRHPFAFIPFSAGPRNCIGQRFAVLELKAALCGILRHFILEPIDKIEDIRFKSDLVLRPEGEVRVKIIPRNSK